MMGMNDCADGAAGRDAFGSNLSKLTTTPMYPLGSDSQRRKAFPPITISFVKLHTNGGSAVDHYWHWLKVKKYEGELLYWLSDGAFHPNELGHREMANLIFKELGIYDPFQPHVQALCAFRAWLLLMQRCRSRWKVAARLLPRAKNNCRSGSLSNSNHAHHRPRHTANGRRFGKG
jgi:hypothetical protein